MHTMQSLVARISTAFGMRSMLIFICEMNRCTYVGVECCSFDTELVITIFAHEIHVYNYGSLFMV